jgi:hypothetical protein
MTVTCPVEGCSRSVHATKLLCPQHWAMVPAATQREVYAAWRARLAGEDGARERHQTATAAAIAAVDGAT